MESGRFKSVRGRTNCACGKLAHCLILNLKQTWDDEPMDNRKIIVVTGGAGLIGSAIVWQLNKLGISNIVIVDHLGESEKWQNLRSLKFLDYMEKTDFIERVRGKNIPYSVDTIFHMGACSSTTEKDASYLIKNNFEFSRDLAICALNRGAKFIYASSAATYGDGSIGYSDRTEELSQLRPLNMYGYSKQLFDQWAVNHNVIDKMIGLKFFNVFGPNEWHKAGMRSMVLKAYEQISSDGKIRLFKSYRDDYKDGEQLRDFIYVKDAVKMTVHFYLNKSESHNGIYNIGTGKARSWNDLAAAAFSAMDKKENIQYIDMPEELRGKYQYFTQAETDKFKTSGYNEPQWSLEEAISDYIQNYLIPGNHLGDED